MSRLDRDSSLGEFSSLCTCYSYSEVTKVKLYDSSVPFATFYGERSLLSVFVVGQSWLLVVLSLFCRLRAIFAAYGKSLVLISISTRVEVAIKKEG